MDPAETAGTICGYIGGAGAVAATRKFLFWSFRSKGRERDFTGLIRRHFLEGRIWPTVAR
jgi:hypothetical protein